jgi:hypothetical protein
MKRFFADYHTPAMLGEFLRTAGAHLVIDTDTARRKSGVLAEALAYARYINGVTGVRIRFRTRTADDIRLARSVYKKQIEIAGLMHKAGIHSGNRRAQPFLFSRLQLTR